MAGGEGTPTERPRSLGVNYLPGSGDMMAYGGLVLAALGVLAWLVRGQPIFLWMVPVGLGVSAYFYPLIEKGVVRLGADERGLYFERLGIVPWDAIASVRHEQQALRTLRLHRLHVALKGPVDQIIVDPQPGPSWKRLMSKAWKLNGDTLSIDLHPLAKDPSDLVDHLLAFRPELLEQARAGRAQPES
ncbi:MAG: hypothetical protein KI785_09560 [Devosiaceae bacterium]|nr:hypothetical protein [Devosiaceae bacterium MH13]